MGVMMRKRYIYLAVSLIVVALPVHGAETIKYTYDARGRLIKVEHSGTVNNGVKTEYTIDKADNRTQVKTTGA